MRTLLAASIMFATPAAMMAEAPVAVAQQNAPIADIEADGMKVVVDRTPGTEEKGNSITGNITDPKAVPGDTYQLAGVPAHWRVFVDGKELRQISTDPILYEFDQAIKSFEIRSPEGAPSKDKVTLSISRVNRDTNLFKDFDNGTFDYLGQAAPQLSGGTPYAWDDPRSMVRRGFLRPCVPRNGARNEQFGPCDGEYSIWPTADMNGPGYHWDNRWADLRSIDRPLNVPTETVCSTENRLQSNPNGERRYDSPSHYRVPDDVARDSGKIMVVNGDGNKPYVLTSTITGLVPGKTYAFGGHFANISFDRSGQKANGMNLQPVQVRFTVNGRTIGTSRPSVEQMGCFNNQTEWIEVGSFFTARSTSVTVRFENLSRGGYGNDFAVDKLVLNPLATTSFTVAMPLEKPTHPGVEIIKKINGDDANAHPGVRIDPNTDAAVTFAVRNTGNTPLENVRVTDDVIAEQDITCPKNVLGIGEEMTCTATLRGMAAQALHKNTATVTGTPPGNPNVVTDTDEAHAYTNGTPKLKIVKKINGHDANREGEVMVLPGEDMNITFDVANIGDVVVNNVELTDTVVPRDQITCPDLSVLGVGETRQCTATIKAPMTGTHHNIARVTGVPPQNPDGSTPPLPPVEDPAYATVRSEEARPAIDIIKKINGEDANDLPGVRLAPGEEYPVTFTITNTGNVRLKDVELSDDVIARDKITCATDLSTMEAGETIECSSTLTLTESGQMHQNIATVTGNPVFEPWHTGDKSPVTDKDNARAYTLFGVNLPATGAKALFGVGLAFIALLATTVLVIRSRRS